MNLLKRIAQSLLGDSAPSQDGTPPEDNFPSNGPVKYYAIVHGCSRGDEWTNKVSMLFRETEDPKVICAILTRAGYFDVASAQEEYEEYKESKSTENLFFYYEVESVFEPSGSGGHGMGEEWYMGFGTSQGDAALNYTKSDSENQGGDDW